MCLPHDHRNATGLTLRDPTQIILVIPLGKSSCFAELTLRYLIHFRSVHDSNTDTSDAQSEND